MLVIHAMEHVEQSLTPMDRYGDRYVRRNGKWAKISKQAKGGYTLVCGWQGEFKAKAGGIRKNIRLLGSAKDWAANWLDDK